MSMNSAVFVCCGSFTSRRTVAIAAAFFALYACFASSNRVSDLDPQSLPERPEQGLPDQTPIADIRTVRLAVERRISHGPPITWETRQIQWIDMAVRTVEYRLSNDATQIVVQASLTSGSPAEVDTMVTFYLTPGGTVRRIWLCKPLVRNASQTLPREPIAEYVEAGCGEKGTWIRDGGAEKEGNSIDNLLGRNQLGCRQW